MSPVENRIGIAAVDQDRCIAWSGGSACLVCVEACPTGAIAVDASGRPIVQATLCNGCGACEFNCPSNSFRAFSGGTLRGINVAPATPVSPSLDASAVAASLGLAPQSGNAETGDSAKGAA